MECSGIGLSQVLENQNKEYYLREEGSVASAYMLLRKNEPPFVKVAISLLEHVLDSTSSTDFEKNSAASLLGHLFYSGYGDIAKDYDQALAYFKRSNLPSAQYTAGVIHLKHKDEPEVAVQHFQDSAQQGFVLAKWVLGQVLWAGVDNRVPADQSKANGLFKTVISRWHPKEPGNCLNQRAIDEITTYAIDHPQLWLESGGHMNQIFSWIQNSSPEKRAPLSIKLGYAFWKKGYTKGEDDAICVWDRICIRPSEGYNNPATDTAKEASCLVGRCYYRYNRGGGFYQEKAVTYWRSAAEEGHILSQYYLGLAYVAGRGIGQDVTKGKEWLSKAAEAKFLPAQNMLDHIEGRKLIHKPESASADKLGLPPIEEEACIHATKSFLNRAWSWLKNHTLELKITAVVTAALAAAVYGLTILTFAFPHVMIPLWIGVGVVATIVVVAVAAFLEGANRLLR